MNLPFETDRLHAVFAAVPGAVIYGLYHFFALMFSGQPHVMADYIKASVNLLCAIVAGGILAYFLAPALTGWIPWAALRDVKAVAFVLGALGWELLPVAINAARGRLGRLGGGT